MKDKVAIPIFFFTRIDKNKKSTLSLMLVALLLLLFYVDKLESFLTMSSSYSSSLVLSSSLSRSHVSRKMSMELQFERKGQTFSSPTGHQSNPITSFVALLSLSSSSSSSTSSWKLRVATTDNNEASSPVDEPTVDASLNPPLSPFTTQSFPDFLEDRGKVNEIDFCMAPSDVSLSRSYGSTAYSVNRIPPPSSAPSPPLPSIDNIFGNDDGGGGGRSRGRGDDADDAEGVNFAAAMDIGTAAAGSNSGQRRLLSLTRALNNVSNRAVRRVLLSKSWPSAEALNLSLRQTLASPSSSVSTEDGRKSSSSPLTDSSVEESKPSTTDDTSNAKCPVPRPILNILMQRRGSGTVDKDNLQVTPPVREVTSQAQSLSLDYAGSGSGTGGGGGVVVGKRRTDEEWIAEQIASFQRNYGAVPGYDMAEAYLECILSLATSGVESPKVAEVYSAGVYDEPYRRLISVLESVGAEFGETEAMVPGSTGPPLRKIAPKLVDQDICLSMLDVIAIQKEKRDAKLKRDETEEGNDGTLVGSNKVGKQDCDDGGEGGDVVKEERAAVVVDVKKEEEGESGDSVKLDSTKKKNKGKEKPKKFFLRFWREENISERTGAHSGGGGDDTGKDDTHTGDGGTRDLAEVTGNNGVATFPSDGQGGGDSGTIKPEDLGGVLLSSEEPSMTRQLNVLSNIVQRAMLFGGDKELLVLHETLEADKPAFVRRWYPSSPPSEATIIPPPEVEDRPGVQYLNCLLELLKLAYTQGVITDLDQPFTLNQSYSNAYERLTASLVELGSGYVRPVGGAIKIMKSTPPKTAKEELGRFAQWEVAFRQRYPAKEIDPYPNDLVGEWLVKDEVQGKTIGVTSVTFGPNGVVKVAPPMRGLRWRLDPGPTHLDTCTFQVLGDDGAILQYRGYVDRGARLEARFSRRAIRIRGAVTFQMRDGESLYMGEDYRKDILPINYKTGTTKFVMTKAVEEKKP